MVGQPLCLVAGARARGAWRVVLDDARGAAGSLLKGLGRRRSHGRARMLCAVPSRLPKMRGDINVKDAGREASCSSDTPPRRAGDLGGVEGGPAFARADLSVFAGTRESTQVRRRG